MSSKVSVVKRGGFVIASPRRMTALVVGEKRQVKGKVPSLRQREALRQSLERLRNEVREGENVTAADRAVQISHFD